MRRPSLTRLTIASLQVALTYLHQHIQAGETSESDREELRRACRFIEDMIAHRAASTPKGKPRAGGMA